MGAAGRRCNNYPFGMWLFPMIKPGPDGFPLVFGAKDPEPTELKHLGNLDY